MTRRRILLAWSSGKDSAWALHRLRRSPDVDLAGLLTTFDQDASRVSMHAVREDLVEAQARAASLPLVQVRIPAECKNEQYEAAMAEVLTRAKGDGITGVAFGDLHLEDIRRYREEKLAAVGMEPLFPLWGLDTCSLARDMVRAGLEARLVSVDTDQLDASYLGRAFDHRLLDELPAGVDPCGERGEFHTFVHAGPMFAEAIPVVVGESKRVGRFAYLDVMPPR